MNSFSAIVVSFQYNLGNPLAKTLQYMKFLILIFTLFTVVTSVAQTDQRVKWHHIEGVQALSLEDPRPIFVEFTADWCGWCKKMEKTTFKDEKVVSLLNNDYYSVKLNFDSKDTFIFDGKEYTSKQLAKAYGIEGLPTMIVFSPNLNDHSLIVGYQKGKQFLSKLEKLKI